MRIYVKQANSLFKHWSNSYMDLEVHYIVPLYKFSKFFIIKTLNKNRQGQDKIRFSGTNSSLWWKWPIGNGVKRHRSVTHTLVMNSVTFHERHNPYLCPFTYILNYFNLHIYHIRDFNIYVHQFTKDCFLLPAPPQLWQWSLGRATWWAELRSVPLTVRMWFNGN